MTALIIDAPMLVLCALCVVAISRYSARLTPKVLLIRATVFLAGIKLAVIWGIAALYRWNDVAGELVAGFSIGFFLPEFSTADRLAKMWAGTPPGPAFHSARLSPLLSGLLLSALAFVSSFILSVFMVAGTLFVKRISLKKSLIPVLTLGLTLCMLYSAALAQSVPTITLPTKTVKILPTDDISVVAWVDGSDAAVPLQTDGVSTSLILALNEPGICEVTLSAWANNPNTPALSAPADISYANHFLIKFSANPPPPATIDPAAFATAGNYRLFNRYQVAYRVKNGSVTGTPKPIQNRALVGSTPDPCRFSPISAAGQVNTTAPNGASGATSSLSGVFQLNEGRLGQLGQQVNQALNGTTTPWIWSVIKFDTQGQLVPFPSTVGTTPPARNPQIFPAYSIYKNGQLVQSLPQGDLQTFINLNDSSQITSPGQIP